MRAESPGAIGQIGAYIKNEILEKLRSQTESSIYSHNSV
jgi:hypothetical protein